MNTGAANRKLFWLQMHAARIGKTLYFVLMVYWSDRCVKRKVDGVGFPMIWGT
jgi:hypothetical protein